jgi:hypothetical protein
MSTETKEKKQVRQYNKMTPEQVASLEALAALLGNNTAAVRALTPTVRNPQNRAWRLKKKSAQMNTETYINDTLQLIGADAVNRLGEIVLSGDEKTALKASMYAIDHIRGQATKKSIALTGKLNIQNVLD